MLHLAQNPDLNFVISAGDQVNKTGKPKEEEYAAYLMPQMLLKSLPVATTIGNHDSLNPRLQHIILTIQIQTDNWE